MVKIMGRSLVKKIFRIYITETNKIYENSEGIKMYKKVQTESALYYSVQILQLSCKHAIYVTTNILSYFEY